MQFLINRLNLLGQKNKEGIGSQNFKEHIQWRTSHVRGFSENFKQIMEAIGKI